MSEQQYKNLYTELEKYEHLGLSISLNDSPASPLQIVNAHLVREESSYMRDYVWDDEGHLTGVTFHNIKSS